MLLRRLSAIYHRIWFKKVWPLNGYVHKISCNYVGIRLGQCLRLPGIESSRLRFSFRITTLFTLKLLGWVLWILCKSRIHPLKLFGTTQPFPTLWLITLRSRFFILQAKTLGSVFSLWTSIFQILLISTSSGKSYQHLATKALFRTTIATKPFRCNQVLGKI